MKKKDLQALHNAPETELKKHVQDAEHALQTLRMEQAQGQLKNTRSIFWRRKEIARLLSIMKRKETGSIHG